MNAWPGPENFLRPSFNPAVTPPDVDPTSGDLIKVAYNPAWSQVLMGAVSQMLQFAAWEGSADDKKLATARALLLMTALQADISTVDTPYWDDDADVDDQSPSDMQPWYGEVTNPDAAPAELDFVENAAIWFFTGLIAIGTAEIAFAPAILFHTIAPRFVIAMKRGDIGEIFRIVIDGQDQARVDTTPYAPGEIINVPLIPADADSHDLLIIGGIAP